MIENTSKAYLYVRISLILVTKRLIGDNMESSMFERFIRFIIEYQ